MDETKQPGITVAQVFLERVEFSHSEGALQLPAGTTANVGDVDVHIEIGEYAVPAGQQPIGAVRVEVSTKPENNPTYQFRVGMLAVVTIKPGEQNMSLVDYLKRSGVALVYPFLREAVANLTLRGRFGPIWLNPINVRVLPASQQAKEGQASARIKRALKKRHAVRAAARRSKKKLPPD